jgi:hypothetical protein
MLGTWQSSLWPKNNYRHIEHVDKKIAHELAACLWSIIVIASELNIDLETEFNQTMDELEARLAYVFGNFPTCRTYISAIPLDTLAVYRSVHF